MKKLFIAAIALMASMFAFSSCNEDSLSDESIITVDDVDYTPFDLWLQKNFIDTYNIDFKYRYETNEADFSYYTVPASYENSIILAHLVKYMCLEAYDEAGGIEFTRANFPKEIFCIGDWEYKNNGTYILGTAEGGRKILLAGVNFLNQHINSVSELNQYYFKTIHHEFTHILNQTKNMPTAYQFVTGSDYVADEWSSDTFGSGYLERGFISAYSQYSYGEDFAEILSMYVCYDDATWSGWMESAGTSGAQLIQTKLDLVKSYMKDSWGIDLDVLHNSVQLRQNNIAAGKVDLTNIDLN